MAEDSGTDGGTEATATDSVPAPVSSWLAERAEEAGVSQPLFARGLATALSEAADGWSVDDLDAEMHELVEDVRQRVLQVKREADAKADADHGHPELERRVEETADATEELSEEVSRLADRVEDTATRLDDGFENYEEVLDYLTETTDDVDAKTQTLARALVDVREAVEALSRSDDDDIDELAREANRVGVEVADCEECGSPVRVGLLREARCPHCGARFTGVRRSSRRFFGSHTLVAGEDRPALEGDDGSVLDGDVDVAAIADGDGTDGGGEP